MLTGAVAVCLVLAACSDDRAQGPDELSDLATDTATDAAPFDTLTDSVSVDTAGVSQTDAPSDTVASDSQLSDVIDEDLGSLDQATEEERSVLDFAADPDIDVADTGASRPMRLVVAGDSWSAGMAFPDGGVLLQAIQARDIEHVTVDFATTAIPGSQADEWADNDDHKLELLTVALDTVPAAEVLFMTLGGNDFLGKAHDNLGRISTSRQNRFLDGVQEDLQTVVDHALSGRPYLTVVIVGYDYLNYFAVEYVTGDLPGLSSVEFNSLLVGLELRKLEIAQETDGCEYAHNLGVLQYRLGDDLFAYGPAAVPLPGSAPDYDPFPGGNPLLPSPLAAMPADGVHPTPEGHRLIIDNALDQGLENVVWRRPWH